MRSVIVIRLSRQSAMQMTCDHTNIYSNGQPLIILTTFSQISCNCSTCIHFSCQLRAHIILLQNKVETEVSVFREAHCNEHSTNHQRVQIEGINYKQKHLVWRPPRLREWLSIHYVYQSTTSVVQILVVSGSPVAGKPHIYARCIYLLSTTDFPTISLKLSVALLNL